MISNLLLPSLRRQSNRQRHCVAVNTKEHTMTVSPVSLAPSNRAQAASDCALLENAMSRLYSDCLSSTSFSKPPKSTAKTSTRAKSNFPPCSPSKPAAASEDCAYCPQSAHHNTNLGKKQMMDVDEIVEKSQNCPIARRQPFLHGRGMARPQTQRRGCRFRNHQRGERLGHGSVRHLPACSKTAWRKTKKPVWTTTTTTSTPTPNATTTSSTPANTKTAMDTLGKVRNAGLKVCCGGIVGMNETRAERAGLIASLANPRSATRKRAD